MSIATAPARDLRGQFWHRPDWTNVVTFLAVATAGSVWFVLLFGASDILTAHRSLRLPIHLAWERDIPLFPGTVWIYMSIYALFLMAPFVLRTREQIIALGLTHASLVVGAALGFLAVPAELAYPMVGEPIGRGMTDAMYRVADRLNLDYNLLPSLHVALSVSCVAVYAPRARRAGQIGLWLWAAAIAASTILTHFHHVLDAATGFALGLSGASLVYPWALDRLRSRRTSPAPHES
jgi:membrane-associated phospholipid phosphatase